MRPLRTVDAVPNGLHKICTRNLKSRRNVAKTAATCALQNNYVVWRKLQNYLSVNRAFAESTRRPLGALEGRVSASVVWIHLLIGGVAPVDFVKHYAVNCSARSCKAPASRTNDLLWRCCSSDDHHAVHHCC